jgi:translation elongation factor EF-4
MRRRGRDAQAQTAREAEGRQERMKTIGNVDIPQKAFMTVLEPEE